MAAPACDSLHKAAGRIPEACRLQPPLPSLHRRHVLWHVVHREINMTLPPLLTPLKLNYWYSATKSSASCCQYSLGIITGLIKKVIYALLCWHWAKTKDSAEPSQFASHLYLSLSLSHSLLPLPEALTWKSKIDSVEIKRREDVGWNLQHYFSGSCLNVFSQSKIKSPNTNSARHWRQCRGRRGIFHDIYGNVSRSRASSQQLRFNSSIPAAIMVCWCLQLCQCQSFKRGKRNSLNKENRTSNPEMIQQHKIVWLQLIAVC